MERIELLWELVERDPLVRYGAAMGIALVWLSFAWMSPLPLVVLLMVAGGIYVVRERRGEPEDDPDELDLL